jgi:hypothetical protein
MDKLKYCTKEIIILDQLLRLKSCGFYKRALSRFVMIRLDAFITLARQANNQIDINEKSRRKRIKGSLNALEELYKEFLYKQRNSFGGHFKVMDFGTRIDIWSEIEYYKIDFFIKSIIEIYNMFKNEVWYEDFTSILHIIGSTIGKDVESISSVMDLENRPRIANDVLALTRPNTVAALSGHPLHERAGILKSLELIINYELRILKIDNNSLIRNLFKELLILDLINYSDALFTRNVAADAKQAMDGLDLIIENKYLENKSFEKAYTILVNFKENYKYKEKIQSLRDVRNKICGHIDITADLNDILDMLNKCTQDDLENTYTKFSSLFKSICSNELIFRQYLMNNSVLHDVISVEHQTQRPFDNNGVPTSFNVNVDYSSIEYYDKYYEEYISQGTEESLQYFKQTFQHSSIVKKIQITEIVSTNYKSYDYIDYRLSHEFFYQKLMSDDTPQDEKIKIVGLFMASYTWCPKSLLYILINTYEENKEDPHIRLNYIYAFGKITLSKNNDIFVLLKENAYIDDLYFVYYSMLAIISIELKSEGLKYLNSKEKSGAIYNLEYMQFVMSIINKSKCSIQNVLICLGLLSEIYFDSKLASYIEFSKRTYDVLLKDELNDNINKVFDNFKIIIDEDDAKDLTNLISNNRFIDAAFFMSNILQKNGYGNLTKFIYNCCTDLIIINKNHDWSLFLKALAFKESGNCDIAIQKLEELCCKSPEDYEYKIVLLELYKIEKLTDKYKRLREDLIDNYNIENDQMDYILNTIDKM